MQDEEDKFHDLSKDFSYIKDELSRSMISVPRPTPKPMSSHLVTESDSLHPDIILLEDSKIYGWIEKQSKRGGYFGRLWKRYYVTCENKLLNYYTSTDLLSQKGMLNFNNIVPKLTIK